MTLLSIFHNDLQCVCFILNTNYYYTAFFYRYQLEFAVILFDLVSADRFVHRQQLLQTSPQRQLARSPQRCSLERYSPS